MALTARRVMSDVGCCRSTHQNQRGIRYERYHVNWTRGRGAPLDVARCVATVAGGHERVAGYGLVIEGGGRLSGGGARVWVPARGAHPCIIMNAPRPRADHHCVAFALLPCRTPLQRFH
jgi:hypothetical protein